MRFAALCLVVAVVATPSGVEAQKRSRDVIKNEEFVAQGIRPDQDLFTVIQRLRPHMLQNPARSYGGGRSNPIRVYVGRNEQPGIETLKSTLALDVEEVRYHEPSDAIGRFGGNANGGAIVLKIATKMTKKDSLPPKDTLPRP